ncbi:hypothetical protein B0A55_00954 [Friedmanniomyces simplex]|uniref:Uncharacterized protein n=1 Tax=Friedmanniomyces simplex TaxID=329884 RepID=A0A4U0Y369_9PEZI|nr:hypothetical protein B0A55_00954 [Friedmanniomyces simplex]
MTPVYALGSPVLTISTTSYEERHGTLTYLSAPTPTCRYTAVATSTDCGQCTLTGGTVQLFYWPPTTRPPATANGTSRPRSLAPTTSVLSGTTLYSPSVYISFETVYASNDCFQVGSRHTSTVLALNRWDVSTQVHIGGMVGQYGANSYSALRYADLTGLPPASEYELQPSCFMVGCPTIYPSSWNPTLVVPSQLRSMDPAWQSCAIGLEGLYDPPLALTPQTVLASVTTSAPVAYSTSGAVPESTPVVGGAAATSRSVSTTSGSYTFDVQDPAAATTAGGVVQSDATESSLYKSLPTAASNRPPSVFNIDPSASINALSVLASAATPTASASLHDTRLSPASSVASVIASGTEPPYPSSDPAKASSTAFGPEQAAAGVTAFAQSTETSALPSENESFVAVNSLGTQSREGPPVASSGAASQTASVAFATTSLGAVQDPEDTGAVQSQSGAQPESTAGATFANPNGDSGSCMAGSSTAPSQTSDVVASVISEITAIGGQTASSARANISELRDLSLSNSNIAMSNITGLSRQVTALGGNTTTTLPLVVDASTSLQLPALAKPTGTLGSQSHTPGDTAPSVSLPSMAYQGVKVQLAGVLAVFVAVVWVEY